MTFKRYVLTPVFLAVLVVGVLAQQPAVSDRESGKKDDHQTIQEAKLYRPTDVNDLDGYLDKYLPGKFNPSTVIHGVTAEGYPNVTFSFFENGLVKDYLLVDRGYYIDLKTISAPAFDPAQQELASQQQNVRALAGLGLLSQVSTSRVTAAETTKTCENLTSTGNPYSCCEGPTGNCTFAAWEHAKRYWGNGYTLGSQSWGNAKSWLGAAQSANFPTSPTPALFSIAVSKTMAPPYGHVGLVTALNGPANNLTITLLDQQCWVKETKERTYQLSNFSTGGYILSPAVNSQSLTVYGMSPQVVNAGNYDQQVLFSVSNIQGNLRAIVIFPSGWRSTLKPSAQIWVYGYQTVGTRMRLSEKGTYSIQFFNTNGVFSRLHYFQVN